jgi:hypothetical protein
MGVTLAIVELVRRVVDEDLQHAVFGWSCFWRNR